MDPTRSFNKGGPPQPIYHVGGIMNPNLMMMNISSMMSLHATAIAILDAAIATIEDDYDDTTSMDRNGNHPLPATTTATATSTSTSTSLNEEETTERLPPPPLPPPKQ